MEQTSSSGVTTIRSPLTDARGNITRPWVLLLKKILDGIQPRWFGRAVLTEPALDRWTASAGGTLDVDYDYPYLRAEQAGAQQLTVISTPAPKPPYLISALLAYDLTGTIDPAAALSRNAGLFVGFGDKAGKLVVLRIFYGTDGFYVACEKWTDRLTRDSAYLTFPAGPQPIEAAFLRNPLWLHISDHATDLLFGWSVDGKHVIPFYTAPRTGWLSAPELVCWGAYPESNPVDVALLSAGIDTRF